MEVFEERDHRQYKSQYSVMRPKFDKYYKISGGRCEGIFVIEGG